MGEIMMWVSRYGMVGIIVVALLDVLNYGLNKINPENERFNNTERFWMIVLWPIMVVTFVGAWFYSWVKRMLNK